MLVVLDTVRADAVSAYGQLDGTTPTVDRLAAGGLRYAHAYSHANWTVPSHAALFTGLLPSTTGMGYVGAPLPSRFQTLAEVLGGGGYETVGFCENPWFGDETALARGFQRFTELDRARENDMPAAVARWARERDRSRPFFLFLNIMDAHERYPVRADNPWLPPWISLAEADHAADHVGELRCATDGRLAELDLLRRLYWQGVQLADAKFGRVLDALAAAGLRDGLRIIVVADHGEHFGEQRQVLHDIGVGEALIHVPLVVSGLPDVAPAVIEAPVGLADVYPTVLGWAGLPGPSYPLVGHPLPTAPGQTTGPRRLVAEFRDALPAVGFLRSFETLNPGAILVDSIMAQLRAFCTPEDRAYGDQIAVIEWPYKLIWFQNFPPQLFDLAQDPGQTVDLSSRQPDLVRELLTGVPRAADELHNVETVPAEVERERADRLRALGYLVK
jgi:arylsulfatase A-like enzyme